MNKVVYFCDRCGKEFNLNSYGIIKTEHYNNLFSFFPLVYSKAKVDEELKYEICPECWKSFKEWFEKRLNEVKK